MSNRIDNVLAAALVLGVFVLMLLAKYRWRVI